MAIFKESQAQEIVTTYLERQGFSVKESQRVPSGIVDVVAESDDERLIIEVKGEDRGGYTSAQMNFQIGIGQLMSRMQDDKIKYFIAFPLTSDFQKVLGTYKETFGFIRSQISALIVKVDGTVSRLSPEEFQFFIDNSYEMEK